MNTVIYLENCLCPQKRRLESCEGTISDLAPEWKTPFIAVVDGQPVLRADWHVTLQEGQVLAFVDAASIPQGGGGGGGSNPLRTVLMLAVMVYAPTIAAQLSYAMGGGMVLGSVGGLAAMQAGVTLVGMSLVNAIAPPPKPTTPQQAAALAAASPTYNLQAQGNAARLEGAIPEHFGRHIVFPDFAANPYAEYSGNEQYLYQLLCIGRGHYALETIKFEDTPIANFEEISVEIVPPFGQVTLFPYAVTTSAEVSGQTLTPDWTGGFVANAEETRVNRLAFDFVASRGMYFANDDGSLAARSVAIEIEYAPVDDYGALVGAWTLVSGAAMEFAAATTTAQRWSWHVDAPAGRYIARARRTAAESTNPREANSVAWAGLRAYHAAPPGLNHGDCTLVAMRLRATDNLSGQATRKINVVATRKLPIWTGSAWTELTVTRSPAWALAYSAKQVGLTDAQIDLQALLTLDAGCAARGDAFDARFDSFINFWEAATKIAQSVRAKPFMQGNILRVVRDQATTIPVALFSQRNIRKGSFSVNYLMPTDDTADSVDVNYFNDITWKPAKVRATLAGSTAAKPARIDLFGVTSRAQAWREGLYQAACNRYRRKIITFQTDMEGFIPSFGDLIAIQHDMPAWGQSGDVVAWHEGTRTLTLSEPPTFSVGTHYIGLRTRDGGISGPYAAMPGETAHEVVLDSVPTITPYVGDDEERTHYAFGQGIAWRQPARVLKARPQSASVVEIEAVNEDDSVHTADTGVTMPTQVFSQLSGVKIAPLATNVTAYPAPFAPNKLLVQWRPAAWADHYYVEQSADGINWTRSAEVSANNATIQRLFGSDTTVRVAAVGLQRGPWVQVAVTPSPHPEDVSVLMIDGKNLSWPATSDQDISGYRIKFHYGANTEWGTANPMCDGLVTSSPYTMLVVPSGQVTIMIRAVDSEGQESARSAYVIKDLGDTLVENVLETFDYKAASWPGSIKNGSLVGGQLVATQGDKFYRVDASNFYREDADTFYSENYDALVWESSGWTPSAASVGHKMTVAATFTGNTPSIQYRKASHEPFYKADSEPFYNPDDAARFYVEIATWQPWPGSVIAELEEYQWLIELGAGAAEGVISAFAASVDVPDKSMTLNDVAIASTGTRLVGAIGEFNAIKNIQVTLQGSTTAMKVEVVDKSLALGPLVIAKDADNVGVGVTIDALIQGF